MEIKFNYIKSNINFDQYCDRVNQLKETFGKYAPNIISEYDKSLLTLNDKDWDNAVIAMRNAHESYLQGWKELWRQS